MASRYVFNYGSLRNFVGCPGVRLIGAGFGDLLGNVEGYASRAFELGGSMQGVRFELTNSYETRTST